MKAVSGSSPPTWVRVYVPRCDLIDGAESIRVTNSDLLSKAEAVTCRKVDPYNIVPLPVLLARYPNDFPSVSPTCPIKMAEKTSSESYADVEKEVKTEVKPEAPPKPTFPEGGFHAWATVLGA